MFVYIRKDELVGVFGLLIRLNPLPVSLAGKKLSKCRHPSTFCLFLLLDSTFNMCLNKQLETRVQTPRCLWSYISAPASQGSNPARTCSPGFRLFFFFLLFSAKNNEKTERKNSWIFVIVPAVSERKQLCRELMERLQIYFKSASTIIWQQNTSSHITHAFANWHFENQSGTKLECLYLRAESFLLFFLNQWTTRGYFLQWFYNRSELFVGSAVRNPLNYSEITLAQPQVDYCF